MMSWIPHALILMGAWNGGERESNMGHPVLTIPSWPWRLGKGRPYIPNSSGLLPRLSSVSLGKLLNLAEQVS